MSLKVAQKWLAKSGHTGRHVYLLKYILDLNMIYKLYKDKLDRLLNRSRLK